MAALAVAVGIAMTLVGVVAAVAGAVAISRAAGLKETLDLTSKANDELRNQVTDLRTERETDRVECAREIAKLEGRLATVTEGFVADVAHRIGVEFGHTVEASVARGVELGIAKGVERAQEASR